MKQFKRDLKQNSNKLHLDKYYTSDEVAQYCVNKTKEIINNPNIKFLEPSAFNLLQWQVYKYIQDNI